VEGAVHAWVATLEWMTREWLWSRHSPRHLSREDVEALLTFFLGAMLVGAASREGEGTPEWLHHFVDAESRSDDSPFAAHLAGAGGLLQDPAILARILGMVGNS
jgi:hypothetical protein